MNLKTLEHDAQDKIPSDIKKKSIFTEIQRKRKGDTCQSLRKNFKPSAKSDSFEDYLFDKIIMKKSILKKLGRLLEDPKELGSQGQKQPILIEVRGPFKIYGTNIPELKESVEKFQRCNISSPIFDWEKSQKIEM